jgi:pyruvate,water dikinase
VVGSSDGNVIAWLGAAEDPRVLGGKGASLDRLLRLGFRVPPGFCLTVDAFHAQRRALDPTAGPETIATAQLDAPLAEALDAAVQRLAAELGGLGLFQPRFAVRSSALGEDGSTASYAGLHDTELDIGSDEIAGAVARCWSSLWSPAALAYRTRRGLADDDAAMAVVVQALVPAELAAVAFTRHPVTGREDQLVATAVRGLGEAMVAGTITPDTYVVDKASRSVVELERGEDPLGPSLDGPTLAELVELSLAVETAFGAAVDIEAAFAGGRWYLLQARPITTGAPMEARA